MEPTFGGLKWEKTPPRGICRKLIHFRKHQKSTNRNIMLQLSQIALNLIMRVAKLYLATHYLSLGLKELN